MWSNRSSVSCRHTHIFLTFFSALGPCTCQQYLFYIHSCVQRLLLLPLSLLRLILPVVLVILLRLLLLLLLLLLPTMTATPTLLLALRPPPPPTLLRNSPFIAFYILRILAIGVLSGAPPATAHPTVTGCLSLFLPKHPEPSV